MIHRLASIVLAVLLTVSPALAVNPDEILDDPVLEERARDISAKLRCLVCQNQSIDDSDADLARDLRIIVRERLVEGDTDGEVLDFVVARYGEFVLLAPRFSAQNLLLWATPLIVLLLGGIAAMFVFRSRRQPAQGARLTAAEQERLSKILTDVENGDR
ncbi:cytochrome c-type biogenesis protein [Oricola cellulosilytica]|uniref:Cytochrome c-type biogenesis protein n=1 Tax=Oricola cellulosilytica TaxID=1429082 RepID=A0A4R0PAR7_9HYPH|nr:cytochrome c-type biogenesis protein [Oricola cellulosilytica]TCD14136.1 cytochrome c-type biogenesis protein CcmH [Oricola cellulosilytica]